MSYAPGLWRTLPATPKQKALLAKYGHEVPYLRGHAADAIEALLKGLKKDGA